MALQQVKVQQPPPPANLTEEEQEARAAATARIEAREAELKQLAEDDRKSREAFLLEQQRLQTESNEKIEPAEPARIAQAANERISREERESTMEYKIKKYGELLKNVLHKMPTDVQEVALYLEEVDSIFRTYEVPNDIKVNLLNPYLSPAARKLVHTLPADDIRTFHEFRQALLQEFSLSPNNYKLMFWKATKKTSETYVTFATRLDTTLQLYLRSRKITNFQQLKNLFISDKLKNELPSSILSEINKKELDNFLAPHDIGKYADTLVNLEQELKDNSIGFYSKESGSKPKKLCFNCSSDKHMSNSDLCPINIAKNKQNEKKSDNASYSAKGATGYTAPKDKSTFHSGKQYCTYCQSPSHSLDDCRRIKNAKPCSCGSKLHQERFCPLKNRNVNNVQIYPRSQNKFHTSYTDNIQSTQDSSCPDSKMDETINNESINTEVDQTSTQHYETPIFNGALSSHNEFNDDAQINNIDVVASTSSIFDDNESDDDDDDKTFPHFADLFESTVDVDPVQVNQVQQEVVNWKSNSKSYIPFHEIKKVNIKIGSTWITDAILDSGSELSIVNAKFVNPSHLIPSHDVVLKGAFGESVQAHIIDIPCKIRHDDGKETDELIITLAVSNKLEQSALITPTDYYNLTQYLDGEDNIISTSGSDIDIPSENNNITVSINPDLEQTQIVPQSRLMNVNTRKHKYDNLASKDVKIKANTSQLNDDHSIKKNLSLESRDKLPLAANESSKLLHEQMITLQQNDVTLASCREMADKQDSKFFVNQADKLLYRKTQMTGFNIHQLVLPKEKRSEIMTLAHDTFEGGHFANKKTLLRIQSHFWWPSIAKDVQAYTQSCKHCQLGRRVTTFDRIPISAVLRPPLFASILSLDLIGPIEPASSRGHKYILSVVDHTTKWPEISCLKSATARETCDALLPIFARIGVPTTIISDNGSNFIAELTKELYKVLRIELRTSSPFHPEGNSIAERWNASLKKLLRIVTTSDKPRQWDKQIVYLLWSFRTSVHSTLGVSPYQMVYGKLPSGPLSILKNSMSGTQHGHLPVRKNAQEYCKELKENLELAQSIATETCLSTQRQYTDYYNRHCKDKHFEPGDDVIILFPDSSNKLLTQFQGPGKIHTKLSEYSYLVEMPNGAIRRLHANKIRKYHSRVNSVGIIFEDEECFGSVPTYSSNDDVTDDTWKDIDFSHLTADQ